MCTLEKAQKFLTSNLKGVSWKKFTERADSLRAGFESEREPILALGKSLINFAKDQGFAIAIDGKMQKELDSFASQTNGQFTTLVDMANSVTGEMLSYASTRLKLNHFCTHSILDPRKTSVFLETMSANTDPRFNFLRVGPENALLLASQYHVISEKTGFKNLTIKEFKHLILPPDGKKIWKSNTELILEYLDTNKQEEAKKSLESLLLAVSSYGEALLYPFMDTDNIVLSCFEPEFKEKLRNDVKGYYIDFCHACDMETLSPWRRFIGKDPSECLMQDYEKFLNIAGYELVPSDSIKVGSPESNDSNCTDSNSSTGSLNYVEENKNQNKGNNMNNNNTKENTKVVAGETVELTLKWEVLAKAIKGEDETVEECIEQLKAIYEENGGGEKGAEAVAKFVSEIREINGITITQEPEKSMWEKFKDLPLWQQILIGAGLIGAIAGIGYVAYRAFGSSSEEAEWQEVKLLNQ